MKILFLITEANKIGKIQVHVKNLAIALQQDSHEVLVMTGEQGIFNEDLKQNDIKSISCKFLRQPISPFLDGKSLRYILYAISEFKPDLIATHSSKTGILGRLAGKIAKIPCVCAAHHWSFSPEMPQPHRTIYRFLEKATASLADKIICVSDYDRTIGLKVGLMSERIVTIYNGIQDISSDLMANPAQSQPVKIAMIVSCDRQKDSFTLIEVFQGLNAELILIGDGSNMLRTQEHVEKLNMSKKVQFLDFSQDIAQILAEVQIFTLISNLEGIPRTIIEAMRAGLPVVVSDVGGVKEIVIDSQTGYLIPCGDVKKLYQKLSYLINNESARSSMGILARQKYESELTFRHMYDKTLAVYQEVTKNPKK